MILNHLLLWLPLIVIAFANAGIRQVFFLKQYGEFRAHQLSTVTLILFSAIYVWLIYRRLQLQSPGQAILVGFLWVLLTVAFEFGMGRMGGKSWATLFQNYNLFAGYLWPVFLVCLFFWPYLFYTLRG